jgi:hypothetical protein
VNNKEKRSQSFREKHRMKKTDEDLSVVRDVIIINIE